MLPAFLVMGQLLAFSMKGLLLWWFAVLGCAAGAFGVAMTLLMAALDWADRRQRHQRQNRFAETIDGRVVRFAVTRDECGLLLDALTEKPIGDTDAADLLHTRLQRALRYQERHQ